MYFYKKTETQNKNQRYNPYFKPYEL